MTEDSSTGGGRYCAACGSPRLEPRGERHWRCLDCRVTEWKNPLPVAGTLILRGERVLLVQRALTMDAGAGGWTYPGGFVERGETPWEAAIRETIEEANVRPRDLRALPPRTVLDPHRVVMPFVAAIEDGDEPSPGPECEAVRWFAFDEIPWEAVPFSTSVEALRGLVEGDRGTALVHRVASPGRRRAMSFCTRCGHALDVTSAKVDGGWRCAHCGAIRWDNPSPTAGLLAIHDRRVLLGRRREGVDGAGKWAVPSGHMEPGETPSDTAAREFREETGLTGRVDRFVGLFASGDDSEAVYLGTVDSTGAPASSEFAALAWFTGPEAAVLEAHHSAPHLVEWARAEGLLD